MHPIEPRHRTRSRLAKGVAASAIALAALTLTAPAASAAPAAELTPEAIDAYMTDLHEASGVPGLSVVVTHDDEIVHAAGYGHDSDGDAITADSPFRVASVSKSFTAMAVMILAEEGAIALDEPVADQLPGFTMADERADEITVRHLLNQTSGFSDTTIDVVELQDATSLEDYVARLADDALATDPGTDWEYANPNFNVAARLVEVASGQTFEAFMEERVFAPLGMEHSATRDETIDPGLGYNNLFGLWMPRGAGVDGMLDDSGSGGIITSAADMGRWLITQQGQGPQLVSAAGLAEMHTPSPVQDYGMGWGVEPDGTFVHSGNLMTFNSVEWIDPESGYGIAVLTNGAGMADVTYTAMEALAAMANGETPDEPKGDTLAQIALAAVTLAAIALGVIGVVRSRRWAEKRRGRPAWRIGLRFIPVLLPAVLFLSYPALVSLISNGRTVTWPSVFYFALPLTLALLVAGAAGTATAIARLLRIRSVGSAA
ncbi:serine hydrolase domain-containing protein [Glycomyces algeriensis]|uniref:Serine hydrolase n=1 Tax=Glycomyces algeriensis TaxID=256037 RepID=A0A9W6LFY6_9ACTN|nr:serine hydrolase domain-containing protein [Glycomyces algeriensis]MDA1367198.1 serine hydrolase [Glycomyces algeriensis]MDR7353418.1 CubicO group peptidase (beta-lactamase class C family) [Glycomyces algeriensis]GLI41114.1 serine hydrolase [Glycomyces algeriensis]